MSAEKGMKEMSRRRGCGRGIVTVLVAGACLSGWAPMAVADDDSQAFSIRRAEWDRGDRELKVEGTGTNRRTVVVTDAGTGVTMGSRRVDDGKWKVKRTDPPTIPCRVRAEQLSRTGAVIATLEQDVRNRPSSCNTVTSPPSLSINDVTVAEGGSLNFTVTLSAASAQTVTVVASTLNGSAGAPGDFTARSNVTLTFPAGTTIQSFAVATVNDTAVENTETFTVSLSGGTNATIARAVGTGTITDNDTALPPSQASLSINDVTVAEGGSATFTVTLSAASTQTVTVVASTANGNATAGSDYTARTNVTLTFPAGTTTQSFAVATLTDTAGTEGNETFTVNLSSANGATIADAQGVGSITNVAPPPAPSPQASLSVNDVTVAEGGSANFTVTLSVASTQPVTVVASTANGSAVAPGDFTARTNVTLTFPAGTTTQSFAVTTLTDAAGTEGNETFTVNLSSANGATIADAQGVGTITNTNVAPPPPPTAAQTSISISDAQTFEGQSATFTVTLSASPSQQVTVSLATAAGTAASPGDFTARTATLNFAAGTTTLSQTFAVTTAADSAAEPNETFAVNLSNASGASIARAQGIGTILDNTQANVIAIHDRNSTLYSNANCTSCHAGMLTEPSLNTAVRPTTAHGTMLRAGNKPGSSGSNNQCRWCHHSMTIVEGPPTPEDPSKGSLRRQVDSALCAMCHGPSTSRPSGSGGRQFYQVGLSSVVPDTDGARLYDMACSACHRPLANSEMRGNSASSIQSAINGNRGNMGPLRALTPAQVQAIANALR